MEKQKYNTILVPVDGSKQATLALKKAIATTKRNGEKARLYIVHIIDPQLFKNIGTFDQSMVEEAATNANTVLQEYVEEAKQAGVKNVEYIVEYGLPKSLIAKEMPQKIQADLIIMGATGLGSVERVFIGSVTDYVIRTANIDVLVIKNNKE